jgi:hypothetical protein
VGERLDASLCNDDLVEVLKQVLIEAGITNDYTLIPHALRIAGRFPQSKLDLLPKLFEAIAKVLNPNNKHIIEELKCIQNIVNGGKQINECKKLITSIIQRMKSIDQDTIIQSLRTFYKLYEYTLVMNLCITFYCTHKSHGVVEAAEKVLVRLAEKGNSKVMYEFGKAPLLKNVIGNVLSTNVKRASLSLLVYLLHNPKDFFVIEGLKEVLSKLIGVISLSSTMSSYDM